MARFTVKGVNIFAEQFHEDCTRTLVLLHGFTGSRKTWQHIVPKLTDFHVVTIDLIGHGQTDAPEDSIHYSMAAQTELLEALFEQLGLKSFSLLGYSMGGRVALSYAVRYPERIEKLLLESASPGLVADEERAARKRADDTLAEKIFENGIVSFVEKWENIPLFASQKALPASVQHEMRQERLMQRETGLAGSLRGMGTGVMPSMWHELPLLQFPVVLLTGSLDEKFENLAKKMLKSLQNGRHVSIIGAGHAIHVENPTKFATIVKEMISED
ncbi:MAG: 2-succinyl-6-hydroxy-2,4-cyclohexadiene-1-carboxylate synthase [Solibacillus sp.]